MFTIKTIYVWPSFSGQDIAAETLGQIFLWKWPNSQVTSASKFLH